MPENCACSECAIERELAANEHKLPSPSRSTRTIEGLLKRTMATDVVRFRCPHNPGCGGCEIHTPRDFDRPLVPATI